MPICHTPQAHKRGIPPKKFWSVENAFKFSVMIIITLIAASYLDWHASNLGGFLKVLGLSIGIVVGIDTLVSLGRMVWINPQAKNLMSGEGRRK